LVDAVGAVEVDSVGVVAALVEAPAAAQAVPSAGEEAPVAAVPAVAGVDSAAAGSVAVEVEAAEPAAGRVIALR
jgi:hypothetical protein